MWPGKDKQRNDHFATSVSAVSLPGHASVEGQDGSGLHDGAVVAADERVDLQVRGVEDERILDATAIAGPGQDGCADILVGAASVIDKRDRSYRERAPGLLRAHSHLYPRGAYLGVGAIGADDVVAGDGGHREIVRPRTRVR